MGLALLARDGRALLAADSNPHAYFESLVGSQAHWKSYSLRDQAQLLEYKNSGKVPPHVTYGPETDTDPHRQDAAKVVVPAFVSPSDSDGLPITLAEPVGPYDSSVKLSTFQGSVWGNGRGMRIGNEVMRVLRPSGTIIEDNRVPVARGEGVTEPQSHAAGSQVHASNNSLPNQVRLPLGTEDGSSYLFVWDDYHTDSYLGTGLGNHKAYQFTSSKPGALWMEPQTRFDGGGKGTQGFDNSKHVAIVEMRAYQAPGGPANWNESNTNQMGPVTTNNEPVQPKAATFVKHPNRWTRHFWHIVQRANDYDTLNYWVADEQQEPVHIYVDVPVSVRGDPPSIYYFWLEYNTSIDRFTRGDTRDLVSYVRNFVALRNVSDVESLLKRPNAGVPLPPLQVVLPGAPKNLRQASMMPLLDMVTGSLTSLN